MSDQRKGGISWTDETWNPVRGCSRVSEGCRNCYAERVAARFSGPGQPYHGLAQWTGKVAEARWTGVVRLVPEHLADPLRWRRPRRVFVSSMSDPFHDDLADEQIDTLFAAMALAPHHTYQLLTKRAERMRLYLADQRRPFAVLRAIDRLEVAWAMTKIKEEWRPLPSAMVYEVSNYGKVRRSGRELAQSEHGNGYRQVAICTNGEPRSALVHRLVLETFDRPARGGEETAHRNADRTDNRIANLRWATKTENMADAARQGTAGAWMRGRATLTPEEVTDIRVARTRGELLVVVAARFGITKQQVSAVALDKIFKPAPLPWPLPNVWLGVSVEDQQRADERIPDLLATPAAVRWVSYEPAIGEVEFQRDRGWLEPFQDVTPSLERTPRLSWVVVGGESGPGARPFDLAWARSTIRQCREAGVACFVKQIGARAIDSSLVDVMCNGEHHYTRQPTDPLVDQAREAAGYSVVPHDVSRITRSRKGGDPAEWPDDLRVRQWPRERTETT